MSRRRHKIADNEYTPAAHTHTLVCVCFCVCTGVCFVCSAGSTGSSRGDQKHRQRKGGASTSSGRSSIGDVDTVDGQRAVLEALVQETEKVGARLTLWCSGVYVCVCVCVLDLCVLALVYWWRNGGLHYRYGIFILRTV